MSQQNFEKIALILFSNMTKVSKKKVFLCSKNQKWDKGNFLGHLVKCVPRYYKP